MWAFGQRMRGVFPSASFPLSPAQVHIDCRGPGADGGGVPSLSSLRGELEAFLGPQDPSCSQHCAGPRPQNAPGLPSTSSPSGSRCRAGECQEQGLRAQTLGRPPSSESWLHHLVGGDLGKVLALRLLSFPSLLNGNDNSAFSIELQ